MLQEQQNKGRKNTLKVAKTRLQKAKMACAQLEYLGLLLGGHAGAAYSA